MVIIVVIMLVIIVVIMLVIMIMHSVNKKGSLHYPKVCHHIEW